MKNLFESKHFPALKKLIGETASLSIANLFEKYPGRSSEMVLQDKHFVFDYSKTHLTPEMLDLFAKISEDLAIPERIEAMFRGKKINVTEKRPALHPALRGKETDIFPVEGKNVMPEVVAVRQKIKALSENFKAGKLTGATGKTLKTLVNIGIGGSYLGPKAVVEALRPVQTERKIFFLSNVDGEHLQYIRQSVDPEETLFIVVSKSFGTKETLMNAGYLQREMLKRYGKEGVSKHFIAVTANPEKAEDFGIDPGNILPMWNWVGGRFSLWSAAGISIPLFLGYDIFDALLEGARQADRDFRTLPFRKNPALIMAAISLYYNHFKDAVSEAHIPYRQRLAYVPLHLQQLFMESLGKHVRTDTTPVDYATGQIVWGETGTNAQHSFFQLLHQGTRPVPVHFIGTLTENGVKENDDFLLANMLAQSESLAFGKDAEDKFRQFEGNRPSDIWLFDALNARNLGYMLATYEHTVYALSLFWDINAFDQFGVELGKVNADKIFEKIRRGTTEQSPLWNFIRKKA